MKCQRTKCIWYEDCDHEVKEECVYLPENKDKQEEYNDKRQSISE
jgi:hypothetical protein